MIEGLLVALFIFVLAIFLGFEVISKVPSILHTPLMSGSNAISGIVLIGALIVVVRTDEILGTVVGIGAVVLATINVVGGFMVTDRMLQMFKKGPNKNIVMNSKKLNIFITHNCNFFCIFCKSSHDSFLCPGERNKNAGWYIAIIGIGSLMFKLLYSCHLPRNLVIPRVVASIAFVAVPPNRTNIDG